MLSCPISRQIRGNPENKALPSYRVDKNLERCLFETRRVLFAIKCRFILFRSRSGQYLLCDIQPLSQPQFNPRSSAVCNAGSPLSCGRCDRKPPNGRATCNPFPQVDGTRHAALAALQPNEGHRSEDLGSAHRIRHAFIDFV